MTAAAKIMAATALVLLALATVGAWLLLYPLRLAAQAAGISPRPKRRNSLAIAAISGLFGIAAGLARSSRKRDPAQLPISEDADYLRGVEAGAAAARRRAGYEDGKLSETVLLEGRPTP